MHTHFHILLHFIRLLHYARLAHVARFAHYARLARLGSVRSLGMMLLMLFFSMLQFISVEPVSASTSPSARENSSRAAELFRAIGQVGMWTDFAPAGDPTDPAPPEAITTKAETSVFHRLKPRIVMIPRMSRTPKPKSVYRCFTRAPGNGDRSLS